MEAWEIKNAELLRRNEDRSKRMGRIGGCHGHAG